MVHPLLILLISSLSFWSCGSAQPQPGSDAASESEAQTVDRLRQLALRGMTFAHEGYDGVRGYDGPAIVPSLDSLSRLNANAVAIVPYTFMREPNVVAELPIPERRGMETDSAVLNAVAEAHRQGYKVMLKPQIWVGHDSWPGDIAFGSEEEWERWFAIYRTWILHYAEMCQSANIEAFCIGTELVQTTLQHPEAWRKIIRDVRSIYSGPITYAANWGEEFENLSFWDELDVVGLNAYYPLSPKPDPTDRELLDGAEAWLSKAAQISAQAGKPLWLTEVGYRSVATPWVNPHAGPGDREVCNDCQLRCYEALLTAARKTSQLEGIFIWKWPSFLGRGQQRGDWHDQQPGRDFTPGGKPAAEVLQKFYSSLE